MNLYQQTARNGPGLVIIEPVSVKADGREHPRQPCAHFTDSTMKLKKITHFIHAGYDLALKY